jgi:hypothetical protein
MTFYETDIFTEQIVDLIDDDSYSELQRVLIVDREAGDLIPGSRVCARSAGEHAAEGSEEASG